MNRLLSSALIILGACVAMDKMETQDVILLSASIQSLGEPREMPSQGNEVNIGALFKVQLEDITPLIGQLASNSVEVDLAMASAPKEYRNREMYVLLARARDGNLMSLTWDYVRSGLCIPKEMAKAYSIEDALVRLRQAGAVNWKPSCDW